ncbi:DUF1737 domain-containing protein [Paraburkholderia sp. GAS32]|uniref:DUF1737 domain-containing protein n=1 Tax=Paraburkholderia sp. GAS32 TaxID=3035129 RepID=UPI003D2210EB
MKYKIIKAANTELNIALGDAVEQVNAAIADGWEPVGGVSVTFVGEVGSLMMHIVCQAATKVA